MDLSEILKKENLSREEICFILNLTEQEDIDKLQAAALQTLYNNIGNYIYIRGLIEFSNYCTCDCIYCGIRKSNQKNERFLLTKDEILSCVEWIIEKKFASVVLQSGERRDTDFVEYVVDIVKTIKKISRNDAMPDGLGITLAVGEQSFETYQKFYEAGAHRYLLRIETSNSHLYKSLHSSQQAFEDRIKCLKYLQDIGFQIGSGVMIGLPSQTIEDLANDILFFKNMDIDMLGMGPFIPHFDTPLGVISNNFDAKNQLLLGLKMIAVARLVLKDVNIASTTALETLHSDGRIMGLQFGANVVMPQATPNKYKKNYLLYNKKPVIDEQDDAVFEKMQRDFSNIGRSIAFETWGDPIHFQRKKASSPIATPFA